MCDFKKRQSILVGAAIRGFHDGHVSLNNLIGRLEGLARIVGSDFWNTYAFPIIVDLEKINSELIDKQRESTSAELAEINSLLESFEEALRTL